MTLEIVHLPERSRIEAHVEAMVCEIDYALNNGVMTILHTGVPSALEGRGIAAELTRYALELARREGWKVVPACSYAAVYLKRHSEYADLLA